jgi:hypothetical protein
MDLYRAQQGGGHAVRTCMNCTERTTIFTVGTTTIAVAAALRMTW